MKGDDEREGAPERDDVPTLIVICPYSVLTVKHADVGPDWDGGVDGAFFCAFDVDGHGRNARVARDEEEAGEDGHADVCISNK